MGTTNEDIRNFLLLRQLDLLRYSKSVQKKIIKLLEESNSYVTESIEKKISTLVGKDIISTYTLDRLKALDKAIKDIRFGSFLSIGKELKSSLYELAKEELKHSLDLVNGSVPVVLDLVNPDFARLRALVTDNPIQGKVLKDWILKLSRDDYGRLTSSVRLGLSTGQTNKEILNNVELLLELTKKQVSTIVRTAIMDVAASVREQLYNENQEVFEKEIYVATLDARTTAICRANDGKIFEKGKGLMPPAHFNCRSIRVPLLTEKLIGNRPFNPTTQKQLLAEYAKQNNLGKITNRDDLPRGTKKDFDTFARKRARELIGTVPASTTYEDFIKAQSVEFQNEVLGKTKAQLFRNGGLRLDQFVDTNGNELTILELSERYKEAFRKAGLL
jgi:SPP1 gp7 family putative phage head morphogenesis protein